MLDRLGVRTGIDPLRMFDVAEDVVRPVMDGECVLDRMSLIMGYAGVYSSFLRHAYRAAERYDVSGAEILLRWGERKLVGGQEDQIIDIALELGALRHAEGERTDMRIPQETLRTTAAPALSGDGDLDGAHRSVLARIDSVVGAFDDVHGELTLHELTQRTELPKSTVHRMVEQLVRIGLARARGRRLSHRHAPVRDRRSRHAARPARPNRRRRTCTRLSAATGLAVQLGILDGTDVVYLERIATADFALPTREGGRQPAYCTALGKAMLAFDAVADGRGARPGAAEPHHAAR